MTGISYPKIQIAILFGFVVITPFSFSCIFPFINQVSITLRKYLPNVIDFDAQFLLEVGQVEKPEDAGYYSGIVESVFAVSQLFVGKYMGSE
jgi:hypothetical protein